MFNLFSEIQSVTLLVVTLAMFGFKAWAFADACFRRGDAFVAADKLTKPAWLIILGLALVAHLLTWSPFGLLNLLGVVAAIVYVVDARPAIQSLTRR